MTDHRHKINKYIISRISKVTSSMEKLKKTETELGWRDRETAKMAWKILLRRWGKSLPTKEEMQLQEGLR